MDNFERLAKEALGANGFNETEMAAVNGARNIIINSKKSHEVALACSLMMSYLLTISKNRSVTAGLIVDAAMKMAEKASDEMKKAGIKL